MNACNPLAAAATAAGDHMLNTGEAIVSAGLSRVVSPDSGMVAAIFVGMLVFVFVITRSVLSGLVGHGAVLVFILLPAIFRSMAGVIIGIGIVVNAIPVLSSLALPGAAGITIDMGRSLVAAMAHRSRRYHPSSGAPVRTGSARRVACRQKAAAVAEMTEREETPWRHPARMDALAGLRSEVS